MLDQSTSFPPAQPDAGAPAAPAGERSGGRREAVIASGELLRGLASVTIDHEGVLYVLRATRAGKLILTK